MSESAHVWNLIGSSVRKSRRSACMTSETFNLVGFCVQSQDHEPLWEPAMDLRLPSFVKGILRMSLYNIDFEYAPFVQARKHRKNAVLQIRLLIRRWKHDRYLDLLQLGKAFRLQTFVELNSWIVAVD